MSPRRRLTSKEFARLSPSGLMRWIASPDRRRQLPPEWESTLPTVDLRVETQRVIDSMSQLLLAPRDDNEACRNLRVLRKYVQSLPYVARAYGSQKRRKPGRPKGRGSLDLDLSQRIAVAVDVWGFKPAEILRVLDKLPDGDSSTADYHWFDRHLKAGRSIPCVTPRGYDALKGCVRTMRKSDRETMLALILGRYKKPKL